MSCGLTGSPHVEHLAAAVQPILDGSQPYQPEPDPLRIVMLACLNFQMRGSMVEKALDHFYQGTAGRLGINDLASAIRRAQGHP